jgi:hypothetical protein
MEAALGDSGGIVRRVFSMMNRGMEKRHQGKRKKKKDIANTMEAV